MNARLLTASRFLSLFGGAVLLLAAACGDDEGEDTSTSTSGSGGATTTGSSTSGSGAAGGAGGQGGGPSLFECSGLPGTANMVDTGSILIASLTFSDPLDGAPTCTVVEGSPTERLVEFWNDAGSRRLEVRVGGQLLTTSHGTIDNASTIAAVTDLPADTEVTVRFDDGVVFGYYDLVFTITSTDTVTVSSAQYTYTNSD